MSGVAAALAAAAVAVMVGARGRAAARLSRAFGRQPPRQPSATATGCLALAAAAGAVTGAPAAVAAVTVAAALAVRVAGHRRRNGERARRRAAVVDVAFAMAAELRAGATPARALEAASSGVQAWRLPLREAAGAVRAGGTAAAELRALAGPAGCPRLGQVAAAWELADGAGAQIAAVLDRLGESFAADDESARELAALAAGPRATMALLAGLPLLGVALGSAVGAHPLHLLLARPLGWVLLAGAALLDLLGLLWVARIVRGAVPGA